MPATSARPWNVSLHGGHSQAYCDHAHSPLAELIETAISRGMPIYGITEHAPRFEERFLYPEEIAMGWDVPKLIADFEAYAEQAAHYVEAYAEEITLLRGFEAEVVPAADYVERMRAYRARLGFDYVVGSVHHVDDVLIDYDEAGLRRAADQAGGLERLAIAYYRTLAEMVEALRPEVVGHFDVIRKHARNLGPVDTPPIREAARAALEVLRAHDCIVDVNTNAFRKGFDHPFPAPWVMEMARDMGLSFCFGDDSHSCEDVGAGIPEARRYLLDHGIMGIAVLAREGGEIRRRHVNLFA